jgi:hypothetical protein
MNIKKAIGELACMNADEQIRGKRVAAAATVTTACAGLLSPAAALHTWQRQLAEQLRVTAHTRIFCARSRWGIFQSLTLSLRLHLHAQFLSAFSHFKT